MQRSRILPALVLLLLVLLIGFSIFYAASEPGRQTLLEIARWLETHGKTGMLTLAGALAFACIFGIPPASILLMTAGSLYGLAQGLLIAGIAVFTGAVAGFLLSRHLVRVPLRQGSRQRISLQALDREIATRGWQFVALLRLSPVFPFALVTYSLGLSSVRLRDFVIGTLGTLPPAFAYIYTGSIAADLLMLFSGEVKADLNGMQLAVLLLGLLASIVLAAILMRIATRALRSSELDQT